MAQRHPTYFDGIVVGAPAMRTRFSGIGDEWVATMLNQVAPRDEAGKPDVHRALSDADRKAVTDGLLAACEYTVEVISDERMVSAIATCRYRATTDVGEAAVLYVAVISVPTQSREGLTDLCYI